MRFVVVVVVLFPFLLQGEAARQKADTKEQEDELDWDA